MNTVVISTCAGEQSRFLLTEPKQLLKFNGVPLLLRTAKQVEEHGHVMHIVTHSKAITDAVQHEPNVVLTYGQKSTKIVSTIVDTAFLWRHRTIILLGDVYYSDDAMEQIFNEESNLMFFGSKFELFAMVFTGNHEGMVGALLKAEKHSRGKLWHLFRYCSGVDWEHQPTELKNYPLLTLIEDETDDMDTLKDYNRLIDKIKRG